MLRLDVRFYMHCAMVPTQRTLADSRTHGWVWGGVCLQYDSCSLENCRTVVWGIQGRNLKPTWLSEHSCYDPNPDPAVSAPV